MRKPTPKQIGNKSTWSPADEAELREALTRVKSDQSRAAMFSRRALAISKEHPDAAMALLDTCFADFPDLVDHMRADALKTYGVAALRAKTPERAATLMQQFAQDTLAGNPEHVSPALTYLNFVAENKVTAHYQQVIALVSGLHSDTAEPDLTQIQNVGAKWYAFSGAAYLAHLAGDVAATATYLAKTRAFLDSENRRASEVWRLWLFHEAKMGGRSVTNVLVRPDFTLSEMRDWAADTFTSLAPQIGYGPSAFGERLTLSWDAFCVDLIILDSETRARNYASYFTKKRLGKFDTNGAKALYWADAGDVDHVDAINSSIQILDYFQSDPRIVVNLG